MLFRPLFRDVTHVMEKNGEVRDERYSPDSDNAPAAGDKKFASVGFGINFDSTSPIPSPRPPQLQVTTRTGFTPRYNSHELHSKTQIAQAPLQDTNRTGST